MVILELDNIITDFFKIYGWDTFYLLYFKIEEWRC